jgi:hypothetical protein
MGREAYMFLVGNTRKTDHLEDSGLDGRIILKCTFKSGMVRHGHD